MFVRTVAGDRSVKVLGFAHCHEHLFVFPTDGVSLPQRLIADDFTKSKEEVGRFQAAGGGALVDAQPFAAGRNAKLLLRLSEETGVHIIASTGLHKKMFYSDGFWSERTGKRVLTDLFISEIDGGMYEYDFSNPFCKRCGVKAGIIKIAAEAEGLTGYYRNIFDAAIEAHRETGAPIMTHTELSQAGKEQAEYLIAGGVPAECIIISHMDRVIDFDKNIELARMGVFLEYDTITRFKYHPDSEEIELIGRMVEEGFTGQLLLGMDTTRDRMLSYGGSFGLEYIRRRFIPALKEYGISEEDIKKLVVENPQKALSFR